MPSFSTRESHVPVWLVVSPLWCLDSALARTDRSVGRSDRFIDGCIISLAMFPPPPRCLTPGTDRPTARAQLSYFRPTCHHFRAVTAPVMDRTRGLVGRRVFFSWRDIMQLPVYPIGLQLAW